MGEVSLIGVTAILCQKAGNTWTNLDDSLCRLEILKSVADSKFRMVAIATDSKCIFNKWVRTNSSITKCSDLFLEIKQVSSQNSQTDFIGVNFAYKPEVDKFYNCFTQCIETLQSQRGLGRPINQSNAAKPPIPQATPNSNGVSSSNSPNQNNLNESLLLPPPPENLSEKSISISNSISIDSLQQLANGISLEDLPLPPLPTTTVTFSDVNSIGSIPAFDFSALPPPPPTLMTSRLSGSLGIEFKNAVNGHSPTLNLTPLSSSPSENGNVLNSSGGSINSASASHLTDLFNQPPTTTQQPPQQQNVPTQTPPSNKIQNIITTTTTTTTTINIRTGSSSDSFLKTASGRRSIRVRHSTSISDQQKKTLGRKDGLAVSLQNVEGLQNIAENLEDETLNFLDLVNEQVVTPESSNNAQLNQSLLKIFEHLQVLFILTGQSSNHPGQKFITQITHKLGKGPQTAEFFSGKVENQWFNLDDVKEISGIHNLLALKKNLISAIAHISTSVRVLGLQASLEIDWMSRNKASEPEKIVVQLSCLTRELLRSMSKLLGATVTYCNVCSTISNLRKDPSFATSTANRIRSPSTADTINIWDELKAYKTVPTIPKDGGILKATLNQLVMMLTSETNYDVKFLKTFITTYQSFASPGILFNKLVERFYVPEWYSTNPQKISTIQQRVIVVLKYWIENQSSDFDQDVIDQIYFFINTLANSTDGYSELARLLRGLLDKVIQEREVKFELLFQMPPRITFEEDSILSPIELFSEWSAQSIAQQLTLIDFSIFKDIEARELLNQNFNKPKLKYKSPNIMRMISKSTQFSFWVAYVILMEPKKEKRIKIFEKFCEIGKYLLKMNNFNTLMGLNAGLNLTCVHRLKKTKKKLSSSSEAFLNELERLFSSKKSFKNYRDHLTTVTLPCIPYLGFNLTDVTFIEEGNTDHLPSDSGSNNNSPLINFKKRELLYQAWADLSRFQETPYTFQPEEPLNTFLLNFPILDEKELYELSVALEPK
ncbi:hypothetical protein DICPUDRAFT_58639 [Dictyostelium purpureum]|uniref:Ras guanine nucleotide exchange factor n=1 Tax=Dictyostelium purpureum TaxID=5786 RepID=F1A251_DICPU|nr:uncharacterized protein DICPUDRAFT_58639 [Dictyostelium purpureum]EGC29734.1 hypothetical protein DICPUDRAFT_58639 [Dictyostelium purpureum]|eukprot:XP_003293745.1 hypothetical protein DICPUDRAFT_58639 [Dictyostelium purpureum]